MFSRRHPFLFFILIFSSIIAVSIIGMSALFLIASNLSDSFDFDKNGAEKVGVIVLGGGLPKHHALGANTLREGVDAAIQVTLDRPEGGSLSGAPLEEAISWKKVKATNKLVTVIGDATIIFPVIVAAVLEELEGRE